MLRLHFVSVQDAKQKMLLFHETNQNITETAGCSGRFWFKLKQKEFFAGHPMLTRVLDLYIAYSQAPNLFFSSQTHVAA
jgi:hypothetical protein